MPVPDALEHLGEVKRPRVERAGQRDRAADLAGDGRHVVPGRLDGLKDPLGAGLERGPVLGRRDRRDAAVEQRHPELPLQAGDGAGHGGLDDVSVPGGGGEAAGLAARQEIVQVAEVHAAMLGPIDAIDCRHRKQPLRKFWDTSRRSFLSLYFQFQSNAA